VESRAVSKSAFDLAQSQARAASANLEAARSQAKAAEADVALSAAGVETANAAVQQAEARLRQAELNLSYTQVTAPEDGRVTRRVVEQGAYIQPGQALMAIVPRHYWVIANFKETQLTHMRVGQPVEVSVDAYPDHKFKGRVESIQSGAGARFSLFPPENATGNYIKVVQRVPVKIVLDDAARKRPGAWPRHVRGSQSAREVITLPKTILPQLMNGDSNQPKINPWLIAIAVILPTFIEVLDTTVVSVALQNIAGNLSATISQATWIQTGYLISNADRPARQRVVFRLASDANGFS
jgi:hypothetical protein